MHEVKFFFYGTLMDYIHPHETITTNNVRASVLGTLFDLGPFPGALFHDGQYNSIIYGNMITFIAPTPKVAEGVLAQFDGYEGYNPEDLEHSLYIRKTVEVLTADGEKHECQAYQFNKFGQNPGEYVPNGDWNKFKQMLREKSDEEDIN